MRCSSHDNGNIDVGLRRYMLESEPPKIFKFDREPIEQGCALLLKAHTHSRAPEAGEGLKRNRLAEVDFRCVYQRLMQSNRPSYSGAGLFMTEVQT